jgi:hypothetical protein
MMKPTNSYTFTQALEHFHANEFRSRMAEQGHSDWSFNMNESQEVVGIYGHDIDDSVGHVAEYIIQQLLDEQDW